MEFPEKVLFEVCKGIRGENCLRCAASVETAYGPGTCGSRDMAEISCQEVVAALEKHGFKLIPNNLVGG